MKRSILPLVCARYGRHAAAGSHNGARSEEGAIRAMQSPTVLISIRHHRAHIVVQH
jgi:hypothetical protein